MQSVLGSLSNQWRDLYVDGVGYIDALRVEDTTANTLGNVNTGAVQIDGGAGIAGNLTVGAGLSVTGDSFFVGVVTFAAGTDGNIVLGDNASDNIVFNADVNSNIIPNTDNTYDLGSSGQEWRDLYLDGVGYIDALRVHDTTANTLGDVNTGAVQIDGGAGIAGNLTVGAGLSVTGNSFFVGVVTFAAGTDGNIVLGDNASDNIVFNADVNSNIIPNTDNAYDLGSSGQEWRDLYLDGVAYIDTLQVHETSVFTGNIDANGNLDVDGHTELDDVNVAGVSTFVGAIDANGGATIDNIQIGITDNNEIDTAAGNLTIDSAGGTTTIDDNVAVTGTFSVSGSIVNIDSADINLGNATSDIITATGRFDSDLVPSTDNARDLGLTSRRWRNIYVNTLDISGDIDVDGQTELDDLNVAGVSTFVGAIDANGNLDVDGQTDLDVLNRCRNCYLCK